MNKVKSHEMESKAVIKQVSEKCQQAKHNFCSKYERSCCVF